MPITNETRTITPLVVPSAQTGLGMFLQRNRRITTPTVVRASFQDPSLCALFVEASGAQGTQTTMETGLANALGLSSERTAQGADDAITTVLLPPKEGGYSLYHQYLVRNPSGGRTAYACSREALVARAIRTPPKPTIDVNKDWQWWLGRVGFFAIPHTHRDLFHAGRVWTGAPDHLADAPVMPVFRIPYAMDSAHALLDDHTMLAQDLALAMHLIGPAFAFGTPHNATQVAP